MNAGFDKYGVFAKAWRDVWSRCTSLLGIRYSFIGRIVARFKLLRDIIILVAADEISYLSRNGPFPSDEVTQGHP